MSTQSYEELFLFLEKIEMKTLLVTILLLFLICCEKKISFPDDIILNFPKNEKLTFEKFNEGVGESGTGLIYIGKDTSSIDGKYFQAMIPLPPLPPTLDRIRTNSIREKLLSKYFYPSLDRIQVSDLPVTFDSLSQKDLKIVIKIQDTIPKYTYNFETGKLKKYKSFPVFVKNISGRKLRFPEFKNLPLALFNNKNEWQIIWNDNALTCGNGRWNYSYWEFQPNEIIILSVNFLTGKEKGTFKIKFGDASSKSFLMNYDKKAIDNQRDYFETK